MGGKAAFSHTSIFILFAVPSLLFFSFFYFLLLICFFVVVVVVIIVFASSDCITECGREDSRVGGTR
jgi:hypothetical protein